MRRRDYYAILEVQRDASEAEIRASYRRLVRQCHPDLHPQNADSAERIKALNEAYEALTKARASGGRDVYSIPVHHRPAPHPPGRFSAGPLWEPAFSGYRLSSVEQMLDMMEELDNAWELELEPIRRLLDLF